MDSSEKKRIKQANDNRGKLSWSEVVSVAVADGYNGPLDKPGEVARFLAFRIKQRQFRGI